ncbi:hypothetical protein NIES4071_107920 (plasmid) [Calothrix sp. NIES-4071]|nr:hypothetical protein NIES4071_107920 [Calothrix sp. NIES-4071]BAZ64832.1 hypothetical protein NIES4105_105650 [Calothrix sp. NIES-4105]
MLNLCKKVLPVVGLSLAFIGIPNQAQALIKFTSEYDL